MSYNSRQIDGRITGDPDYDRLADGWSIGDISIVRERVKMADLCGTLNSVHPDKFRLVLNGAGHELVSSTTTGKWGGIRYYAKDGPGIYVERINHPTGHTTTTPRYYWYVMTPEGTKYRLGYDTRAEEYQSVAGSQHHHLKVGPDDCADDLHETRSGIAWHVDKIEDVHGNYITYDYLTRSIGELYDGSWWLTTVKNRVWEIAYNRPPAGGTAQSRIVFRSDQYDNFSTYTYSRPIKSIYVFEGGSSTPRLEYRIDSEIKIDTSNGCGNYNIVGGPNWQTATRVINSIQLLYGTDSNPGTVDVPNSNGIYALPETAFTDVKLAHYQSGSNTCFYYRYLKSVDNGYGGTFTFDYFSDARREGQYSGTFPNYSVPKYGYSYVVAKLTRDDGQAASTSVNYSYNKPCYDMNTTPSSSYWGTEVACPSPDANDYGPLVGFWQVTITNKDGGGTTLNVQRNDFLQSPYDKIGKLDGVFSYLANGTTLVQVVDNSYTTTSFATGVNFTYLSQADTTVYESGYSYTTQQKFGYDTSMQGSAQYGNQTVVWDYGSTADPNDRRTIITCYYPNVSSTKWLVGLPALQRVFAGELTGTLSGYCADNYVGTDLLQETRTIYDGNGSSGRDDYDIVPTKGLMTTTYSGVEGASVDGSTTGLIQGPVFTYNAQGLPTVITDSGGAGTTTTTVTYDSNLYMLPLQVTLAGSGITTRNTYYQFYGINGIGSSVNLLTMPLGAVRRIQDPNGIAVVHEYDPFGRLFASYEQPSGGSTAQGSANDPWDGDPNVRYRYWDNVWNHSWISDPMAITEESRTSSFMRAGVSDTKEVGAYAATTYYDGFGRTIQTRDLYHDVSGYGSKRDLITLTGYHANGQANCQSVQFSVDHTAGLVTDACTSKPRTSTTYDDLGRPTAVTMPDGNSNTFAYYVLPHPYGGYGNVPVTNTYDALNRVRSDWTDVRGQLIRVVDHTGTSSYAHYGYTDYTYDLQGNLTQVQSTDVSASNVLSTTLTYDVLGRKVEMSDPDMGSWDYTYDAHGNLVKQIDGNGDTLCFYYDVLDRLKTKSKTASSCPGSAPIYTSSDWLASYYYDSGGAGAFALGQLTQVSWDRLNTYDYETFSYDSQGRLVTHARHIQGTTYSVTNSTFDEFNRPETVNNAYGETVTFNYDYEGLNTMQAGSNLLVDGVTYNDRSQMVQLSFANSVDTTYSYFGSSDNYRLQQIKVQQGTLGPLHLALNYTYDDVGNITKIIDYESLDGKGGPNPRDTQNFAYDELNRLISADGTHDTTSYNYDLDYTYDAFGNIKTITDNDASTTKTYNYYYTGGSEPPHGVNTITQPGPDPWFNYDTNGNMTDRSDDSGYYLQDFDEENRLIEVTDNGSGDVTTFYYDANGQRTITVFDDGATTETTHYPFPDLTVEDPGGGSQVKRVTYFFNGQAVAVRVDDGTPALSWIHTDHLGSTSVATDGSGYYITGSRAKYMPFGEERQVSTADLNDRGFTGHIEDDYIKLVYMNARWYAPGLGRFLSADTIVPNPGNSQSYNRFSYVRNNPIRFNDPTGHRDCEFDDLCGTVPPPDPSQPRSDLLIFVGEQWTQEEAEILIAAASAMADQMANDLNRLRRFRSATEGTEYTELSATEVFTSAFGGKITMRKTTDNCPFGNCRAWVNGNAKRVYVEHDLTISRPELFVHEFFHILDLIVLGGAPSGAWQDAQDADNTLPNRPNVQGQVATRWGYAGGNFSEWQKSKSGSAAEEFADMGIGWTYGQWDNNRLGQSRADFMNGNMANWLDMTVGH